MFRTMIALALTGAVLAGPAQAKDATVESRLTTLGMKINTDDDGDYRLVYNYADEGRTQLVYIAGATLEVGGQRIRKIFSPAALLSSGKVDGTVAAALLEESGSSAYGAWEVRGGVLFYAIEVPEPLAPAALKAAMDVCAERADNKERDLVGGDEF